MSVTARRVLIAGAGPVGLAAAVEFRRRGFAPRIVDAGEGPTPEDQSRALGVLPRTQDRRVQHEPRPIDVGVLVELVIHIDLNQIGCRDLVPQQYMSLD